MKHDIIEYRGKEYPCRFIDNVPCGSGLRTFLIGSEEMRKAMEKTDGSFRQDAVWVDKQIFHYLPNKLLKTASDADIIKEIEADDCPKEQW